MCKFTVVCVCVYALCNLHCTETFISDIVAYLANCLSFNKLECSREIIIRLGKVSLDQMEIVFPLQGTAVIVVQIVEQYKSLKSLIYSENC